MLTALIFILAIAFEIVGVLAYMLGAFALWAIVTNDIATLNAWSPASVGLTKRKLIVASASLATGGFAIFLLALSVTTRIIAA